jgi:hypothetical protein
MECIKQKLSTHAFAESTVQINPSPTATKKINASMGPGMWLAREPGAGSREKESGEQGLS